MEWEQLDLPDGGQSLVLLEDPEWNGLPMRTNEQNVFIIYIDLVCNMYI